MRREEQLALEREINSFEYFIFPVTTRAARYYVAATGGGPPRFAAFVDDYGRLVSAAREAESFQRGCEYLRQAKLALLRSLEESLLGATAWQLARVEELRRRIRSRAGSLPPMLEAAVQAARGHARNVAESDIDHERRIPNIETHAKELQELKAMLEHHDAEIVGSVSQVRVFGVRVRAGVAALAVGVIGFSVGVFGDDLIPRKLQQDVADITDGWWSRVSPVPTNSQAADMCIKSIN